MDDGLAQGAWQLDPDTRIAMRLEQVRSAWQKGAWREVILEAEELLDESPSHPEALFLLGEALLEVGDWTLAREVYEHRVSIDGGDTASLTGLAIASYHLTDLPAAAESAREAIRLDGTNAEAHHVLGLALELTPRRTQEALSELVIAAQLDGAKFPLPLSLKRAEWMELLAQALEALHPRLTSFYEGLRFDLEDLPNLEELRATDPPLSPSRCALARGAPPDEGDPFEIRPSTVCLYTRNLGRAGSAEAIVSELVFSLREEALD